MQINIMNQLQIEYPSSKTQTQRYHKKLLQKKNDISQLITLGIHSNIITTKNGKIKFYLQLIVTYFTVISVDYSEIYILFRHQKKPFKTFHILHKEKTERHTCYHQHVSVTRDSSSTEFFPSASILHCYKIQS